MVVLDVFANWRIRLLSHGQLLRGLVNTVVGKGPTVRVGDNHPRPSNAARLRPHSAGCIWIAKCCWNKRGILAYTVLPFG